jgi:hypothetical protein
MTSLAAAELGSRDSCILEDLLRVRLLTGRQIERLYFHKLSTANAQGSARRRSLARLVTAEFVTTLPRRVGGERAGSGGLVYQLTSRGLRLVTARDERIRQPWPIGWPFVQHTLDIAELYVRLRERERSGQLGLVHFAAEPACWHQTALGPLKPDAFVVLESGEWEEHYWLEVDRSTESLAGLRRKLNRYVQVANLPGGAGPLGVIPHVSVTVPSASRRDLLRQLLSDMPEPALRLISVELFQDAFNQPP